MNRESSRSHAVFTLTIESKVLGMVVAAMYLISFTVKEYTNMNEAILYLSLVEFQPMCIRNEKKI